MNFIKLLFIAFITFSITGCSVKELKKEIINQNKIKEDFLSNSKDFYSNNLLKFKKEYIGANFSPLWFVGPNFLITQDEYKIASYSDKPLLLNGFGFKNYIKRKEFSNYKPTHFNNFEDLYVYMLNKLNNKKSIISFIDTFEDMSTENIWTNYKKERDKYIDLSFQSYLNITDNDLKTTLNNIFFISLNGEKITITENEIDHYVFILSISKQIIKEGFENEI